MSETRQESKGLTNTAEILSGIIVLLTGFDAQNNLSKISATRFNK